MDIKNENITAEWARKASQEILGAKVQEQLNKCFINIKSAVSQNKLETSISMYADKLTITELAKRGFTCKQYDDQRDGSYLSITW
jgi:hypothetical protein